jgi:hypothetical protein
MRLPQEYYQMTQTIAVHLPHLRPAHWRGLALWVYGTLLAQSACQNAVITALLTRGAWHTVRQRLREWLYDGADKADPCHTQVEVTACFAPLLGWVLAWWQGEILALALDGSRTCALRIMFRDHSPIWLRGCISRRSVPCRVFSSPSPSLLTCL